jgi:glycosyltransferase involved in cell wall biosynthesis
VKLVYLASHPIQYQAPLFRELARRCEFEAWFAHRPTAAAQGDAGYGVPFEWDVDLLEGYSHRFLENVSRAPSVLRFGGCDIPEVAAYLAQSQPGALVVGGWNLKSYWQGLWSARRLGIGAWIRTDSRWRGSEGAWRRATKRLAYRLPLHIATGFLVAGTAARRYLKDLGVPESRIALVPHTVDVTRFAAGREALPVTRDRLGLGEGPVVGFVGRLIPLKRVADLLQALALVPDLSPVGLVVGDGPERASLEGLARALRIRCVFAGFRNQAEVPDLYRAMQVLVLPSEDEETWGLVVNEALASGCSAVVSAGVGCALDLAAFEPAVKVFPIGDTRQLALQIRSSLEVRGTPQALGARLDAVASFSPERAACALLAACARRTP